MQKAKVFDRHGFCWLLFILMVGSSGFAGAQSPSLSDVVESAKQAKLQEYGKSLSDTFKSTPATDVPPPRGLPSKTIDNPLPVPAQPVPVLRAIYGINELLEAELMLDGQSYSIYSDDERIEVGQWTHGRVFHDGVVLLRAPLTVTQMQLVAGPSEGGIGRKLSCSRLGLKRSHCLVLMTNKASSGTATPVPTVVPRGTSAGNAPLPPLPLPR
jgi:hypothetical protein